MAFGGSIDDLASVVDRSTTATRFQARDGRLSGPGDALGEPAADDAAELAGGGHERVVVPVVHVVTRLEKRGLVRREPDATDGRFTKAILTEEGLQTLAEAAPRHVAHVRSLVIDVLSPEQLRRLGRDADRIMARIDTSAIN